jgi:hypothetical protein
MFVIPLPYNMIRTFLGSDNLGTRVALARRSRSWLSERRLFCLPEPGFGDG